MYWLPLRKFDHKFLETHAQSHIYSPTYNTVNTVGPVFRYTSSLDQQDRDKVDEIAETKRHLEGVNSDIRVLEDRLFRLPSSSVAQMNARFRVAGRLREKRTRKKELEDELIRLQPNSRAARMQKIMQDFAKY